MPTKKGNTKQEAAHVAGFINDPRTPMIFQTALFVFMAHAANATGINIVGGKDRNTISEPRLAQFIKRAEGLGYDERGLFGDKGAGEGDYLIKPEGESPTPRADAGKGATIEARAEAIIKDAKRYDIDTCLAVQLALKNFRFNRDGDPRLEHPPQDAATVAEYERKLRDLCDRAESGESLADLDGIRSESVDVARATLALFDMPRMPDFLLDALSAMFDTVAAQTGVKLWLSTSEYAKDGDWSLERLARACEKHEATSIHLAPKLDLAGHVAAVMNDDDTPAELYNAMLEVLTEFTNERDAANSPEVIRVGLEVHKKGAGA